METEEGGVMVTRGEIDTRAPFRSVKEAVILFGERVLSGEDYTNKLNEMRFVASTSKHRPSHIGSMKAELEETKKNLEKAREESLEMANCLSSLRAELEVTKNELKHMKERESEKRVIELEIEDLKFVESTTKIQVEKPVIKEGMELQKNRSVKFADPPTLAQVLEEQVFERQLSVDSATDPMKKRKKKKAFIPFIGVIFSKKKGYQEGASPKAHRS
ncbi:WEB family protein At3g51220 isoform X2 [Elaeis guineensis]|nr:WEB family protein At3g51220 isoform X2 [Elaeis guineensis]XP_029116140.1 WEB family protein At3g51220 isoform X2 [Elaeis guineensis]XP_029116141.1 WEB family protein At3g51220 isoform X2 [Elaeis guineensis]XP_029116142.1 WEB family protein At3g51220 isoform X2 [Elaeis guineensis]